MVQKPKLEKFLDHFEIYEDLNNHIETVFASRTQRKADLSRLGDNHPIAGVLIPLIIPQQVIDNNLNPVHHTHILYEKRADTMKNHPGDIAFPGGTMEVVDDTPKDAAYREANEEVGINPDDLEFVAYMDEFVSSSKILVYPVIAWLVEDLPLDDFSLELAKKYYPRTNESTATVVMPLTHLLNPKYYYSKPYHRNGTHVGWVRYFNTTEIRADDHIWGLTASMTRRFLDNAFPDNDLPEEII